MAKKIQSRFESPQLQKLRAHARHLILSRRADLAEGILRQILAMSPDDPDANRQLAGCLLNQRQTDAASEQIERALTVDPSSHATHSTLGVIRMVQNRFEEAVAAFEKCLELKADYGPAVSGLAAAYGLKAKWPDALVWADRGLAIKADQANLLRIRGECLAALGRNDEALQVMEQFMRLDPDVVESQLTASGIMRRIGRTQEAIEFARRALEMKPADPHVQNTLASLNLASRKFDEANRHFKEAADIYNSRANDRTGTTDVELSSLLGQAAVNLNKRNFKVAETQYRRILELKPENAAVLALIGGALGAQHEYEQAFLMVREAAKREPKLLAPRMILGGLLVETEQFDEALDQARQMLELFPDAAEPHRLFASTYLKEERFAEAVPEAKQALELKKQDASLHRLYTVALAGVADSRAREEIEVLLREGPTECSVHEAAGYAFYLLGDYQRAEVHCLRMMKLDASGLTGHGRLGLVYYRQGKLDEARPLLEKSLAFNPNQRRIREALADIDAGSSGSPTVG